MRKRLVTLGAATAATGSTEAAEALDIAIIAYRARRHSAPHAQLLSLAYAANARFDKAADLARRALDLAGPESPIGRAMTRKLTLYAQQHR